jgi:hypothetical protein
MNRNEKDLKISEKTDRGDSPLDCLKKLSEHRAHFVRMGLTASGRAQLEHWSVLAFLRSSERCKVSATELDRARWARLAYSLAAVNGMTLAKYESQTQQPQSMPVPL